MSEHEELEQMLSELPLREPSRMLDARVAQTLRAEQAPPPLSSLPYWLGVAAAVLVVGGVALSVVFGPALTDPGSDIDLVTGARLDYDVPDQPTPREAEPTIIAASSPVESVNLLWSRDLTEQDRYTPEGEPYTAVVREVIDHKAWVNPETGETGVLCIPREEVVVIKQTPF